MRRSVIQLAAERQFGRLKSPTKKQIDAFVNALMKEHARRKELETQLLETQRKATQIKMIVPNASAALVVAVQEFLAHKRRLRQSIYEGVVNRMRIAVEKIENENERGIVIGEPE